jgi:hypothetical protein
VAVTGPLKGEPPLSAGEERDIDEYVRKYHAGLAERLGEVL